MSGKTPVPPPSAKACVVGQTIVLSASASASVSYPLINDFGHGLIAYFTIHALPASASTTLALKIQSTDPATGAFYTILAGAARSASGMTTMMICPGISASALGISAVVPRNLRFLISASLGATSKDCVFSLGIGFTT